MTLWKRAGVQGANIEPITIKLKKKKKKSFTFYFLNRIFQTKCWSVYFVLLVRSQNCLQSLMKSVSEGLASTVKTSLNDSTTRPQPSFSSVMSELRKRNVDPLSDPDYTLIVRVQDLGGMSDTALSGNTRVQIIVLENLWVNPGPVVVREHLKVVYPRVIAKVSVTARASSSRS